MEMHQLRYFAKAAELGNVTRAAEACFVSQPSLSQQLAKLERELGRPLFERLGRGVRLTDAGHLFRQYADQILALAAAAAARVADDPDRGRLTVAAIPTIAPYFLPEVLVRFAADCPAAEVQVAEETTDHVLKSLADGDADLAVLALPVRSGAVRAEALFTEELVAAVPAGHRLAGTPRLKLGDLTDEPFVLLNEAHCLTGGTLSFCTRHGVSPIVTANAHQLSMVLELVRLGHGVSLVPAMAARRASEGVAFRPLAGDKPTRTVALAWNPNRFRSKLVERFIETIKAGR